MSRDRTFVIVKSLLVFPDRTFASPNWSEMDWNRTLVFQVWPFVKSGFPDAFSGMHFYESGLPICHALAL